jgi:transposase
MARIEGVKPERAGWFVRFVYWMTRRKVGRLVVPVTITAHHPRLLRAMGEMEQGQAAARSVDAGLKALAEVKTGMLIGCPF